ncbi:hypothetical protein ACTHGU_01825 [Chitinophagaceae bacterium MMS25-I14]
MLYKLKKKWIDFISMHYTPPDYLLITAENYKKLKQELELTDAQHIPYVHDITIIEADNAEGYAYVKK